MTLAEECNAWFPEIWNLNPSGDQDILRNSFYCELNVYNFQNASKELTPEEVFKSYRDYMVWWKKKFGERELKYIGKKDELRDIGKYIEERLFLEPHTLPKVERDYYLFGDHSDDDLHEQVKQFKKFFDK